MKEEIKYWLTAAYKLVLLCINYFKKKKDGK